MERTDQRGPWSLGKPASRRPAPKKLHPRNRSNPECQVSDLPVVPYFSFISFHDGFLPNSSLSCSNPRGEESCSLPTPPLSRLLLRPSCTLGDQVLGPCWCWQVSLAWWEGFSSSLGSCWVFLLLPGFWKSQVRSTLTRSCLWHGAEQGSQWKSKQGPWLNLSFSSYEERIYFVQWKQNYKDFTGSPVVKTLPSNAGGCRFNPWPGRYDPTCRNIRQKQYCNKFDKDFKNRGQKSPIRQKEKKRKIQPWCPESDLYSSTTLCSSTCLLISGANWRFRSLQAFKWGDIQTVR